MLKPDTLIHNRYRVVRLLGQGGFGAVYEAVDERLNRRVALKQLVRVTDRISRQFTNEAQLLANLHHPALPRVTDHFADPIGPCLVMDFIAGDDLATLLYDRNAPFPLDQVLRWGDQLLDVLHYLHTLQPPIIHRDLKPQNLKLRPDGSLILLDFGLAKGHVGDLQPSSLASSMTAFTRGFAPPEQVEGTGTDARSDLYALGATLYCLLTNTAPPEAQSRLLTVMRGRGDALRPAHILNPEVPQAVSEVLQQAMALEIDDRPADARALRTMLAAAVGGVQPGTFKESRQRLSMPTEVDEPVERMANPGLDALYQQATAHMAMQRWAEARHSFEAVEQQVPRYRDTRIFLSQLRQQAERQSQERAAIHAAEPPVSQPRSDAANPPSQPRTSEPAQPSASKRTRLWPMFGGAAVAVAVLVVLALQTTGVIDFTGNSGPAPTARASVPAVVVAASSESAPSTPAATPQVEASAPARPTAEPTPAPAPSLTATPDLRQEVARRLENAYAAFQRRGGLENAIEEANAAAKLDPKNAEPHALLALLYMQLFDWDEVAKQAQAALQLDTNHAAAYSFLSQARREQGDLKQALADAEKAIELDPDLSLGYTARAFVQLELAERNYDRAKLDAALADTEKAVELASAEDAYHRVEAYAAKAGALSMRHQFTQEPRDLQLAIEEYRQAIGSHVEIGWHYSNLGNLLSNAGRYEDANKAFAAALERDPDFYGAYEGRGWMHYAQADYQQAIADFTKAIELNQTYPSTGSYLGRAFAHQANAYREGADKAAELQAARSDLTRATELEPDRAWHWQNLGAVLQDAEDPTAEDTLRKAIGMFKWDLQSNPQNASAYEGLGWTYLRLNDLDPALKAFEDAIAANSKLSAGYQGKAYVLSAQQRKDEACSAIADGLASLPADKALAKLQQDFECQ